MGWRRTHDRDDEVVLEPPEGSPEDGVSPDILFLRVPEPKTVKNRLHIDLRPVDQAAEVARLEASVPCAPTSARARSRPGWCWDPDGNEFCVLRVRLTSSPTADLARPPGEAVRGGGRTTG